ncbi:hypothetical protein FB45DRAFT_922148, partial [Roridomyces roridus]
MSAPRLRGRCERAGRTAPPGHRAGRCRPNSECHRFDVGEKHIRESRRPESSLPCRVAHSRRPDKHGWKEEADTWREDGGWSASLRRDGMHWSTRDHVLAAAARACTICSFSGISCLLPIAGGHIGEPKARHGWRQRRRIVVDFMMSDLIGKKSNQYPLYTL